MKYSKKYLKEYDKTHEFIPLTRDYLFKAIMLKNIEIFKKFLINTLYLDLDPNNCNIIFIDKELVRENKKEHGKVVDLNVKLGNNLLINIEVNTYDFSLIKRRNQLYIEKLDTLDLEVGDKYNILNNKYTYQLNLNAKEKSKIGEEEVLLYNVTLNEIFDDKLRIIIKNLGYYKNKYKKDINLGYDEIFMAGMMASSYEELYDIMSKILKGDKLNKFIESVIKMNMDNFVLHEWEKEKFDFMLEENIKKQAREEGLKEGLDEGKTLGIEEKTIEMIKSMLENNLSYEIISKVSGKNVDEIKEIEKSLKD